MLTLLEQGRPEVRGVAEALLGLEVWVGWPHLVEAKVVAVQSSKLYIDQSAVIGIFLSKWYFKSRNCLREVISRAQSPACPHRRRVSRHRHCRQTGDGDSPRQRHS